MDGTDIINLSIGFSSVFLSVLSIVQVAVGSRAGLRMRSWYYAFNVWVILFSSANLAGLILKGQPGAAVRMLLLVSNYCEFLFAGVLACLGGFFLLSVTDPRGTNRAVRTALCVLFAAHFLLLTFSQFTGLLYTVDAHNIYRRSPLYPLSLVAPALMMFIGTASLVRGWGSLTSKERVAFTTMFAIPLAAMSVQAFLYGVSIIVISVVISTFVMLIFIISDRTEQYFHQAEENTRLKMDVMLSQIQPHFLYNTLGTIQELCRTDPETASEAVGRFTDFLRHNMYSIKSDRPIPFRQELEHVHSYLSLQTLRFDGDVRVVYDLDCTDFFLPTLTLQPLVENAVTHGIRETQTGTGTVTVSTRDHGDHFEVSVTDDGAGFDPEQAPRSENHVGIRNVRERLRYICGGELVIDSAPGRGTRAVIRLPKEKP
ncbi:MAG: histidine kinase [Oscillospiraceae bacterium]|nr:histidine kinase [Oscillospiraceae bacterium]